MNKLTAAFLRAQNRKASESAFRRAMQYDEIESHYQSAESPNNYKEYDVGNKNVRGLDGRVRSVKTKKIKDTDGRVFFTFDSNSQL